MWRERRWRLLLNLIDHLPRNSWYAAQLLDDEELAERIASAEQAGLELPKPVGEHISEWSPLREGLARIEDTLKVVVTAVLVAGGVKQPPKLKAAQRPVTAFHRVRDRRALADHKALVARILPKGGE